jgi:hypothetical protein
MDCGRCAMKAWILVIVVVIALVAIELLYSSGFKF